VFYWKPRPTSCARTTTAIPRTWSPLPLVTAELRTSCTGPSAPQKLGTLARCSKGCTRIRVRPTSASTHVLIRTAVVLLLHAPPASLRRAGDVYVQNAVSTAAPLCSCDFTGIQGCPQLAPRQTVRATRLYDYTYSTNINILCPSSFLLASPPPPVPTTRRARRSCCHHKKKLPVSCFSTTANIFLLHR
jgi:hypothetical protein